jgi:hypothetical protein
MRANFAVKYDLSAEDAALAGQFEFKEFKQVIAILNLINDKYALQVEAEQKAKKGKKK